MKLLVTGGAGFIGSNFIHYWHQNHPEDKIVNLDKLTYAGNLQNLKEIEQDSNYSFVKGDITDTAIVEKVVKDVDIIVHFAAESHVDRSILEPDSFVQTNVVGTFVLLESARKFNTRFHHVSTDEVFGTLPLNTQEKFSELSHYDPSSPYSATKASSDHLVRAYYKTYQLPVTISNCSNNFGPYMFPEKLIPLTITNALEDKPIPVYGKGNQVRDWLYVEDHCRAIDLIISKGNIGETYCIGGQTEEITNLEVVQTILRLLNKPEDLIQFVTDRPGHDERYAIDWSKAKKQLGYSPKYSFEEYIQHTINWYQANKPWWQAVKAGTYQQYYKQQYGG